MTTRRTRPPPLRLTRDQCRAVDRYAIDVMGVPSLLLMENAGRNGADRIERWVRSRTPSNRSPGPIAVVCGKGNNGGDGFVIARHLANHGCDVNVDLAANEADLSDDARVNHAVVKAMGIPVRSLQSRPDLASAARRWRRAAALVDALLGTGVRGPVRGHLADVIERMNAIEGPLIVAIDVPSGLDADQGHAPGPTVRADHTLSFLAPKTGYAKRSARPYIGRVTVADIGVPTAWILERLAHPSP